MSHIQVHKAKVKVDSLDLLDQACQTLGTLQLHRGATKFNFYANQKGDCVHKISSTREGGNGYEIGLRHGNEGTYDFAFDPWGGKSNHAYQDATFQGLKGTHHENMASLLQTYEQCRLTNEIVAQGDVLDQTIRVGDGSLVMFSNGEEIPNVDQGDTVLLISPVSLQNQV